MNINEILEKVLERIAKNRQDYVSNEANVRAHLINPVLRSLGWDPDDPNFVKHNQRTQDGYPDYTLLRNGKTALFLEAKKLGANASDRRVIEQLGDYCYKAGCDYGLLSNGSVFVLFRSYMQGVRLPDRVIWQCDLESDSITVVANRLLTISHEGFDDLEERWKQWQKMEEVWNEMKQKRDDIVMALAPVLEDNLRITDENLKIDQIDVRDFMKEKIGELLFGGGDQNVIEILQ